jgi:hypothetical protein
MPQQFSNNARSALAAGVSDTATSLTISVAAADLFPVAKVNTGTIPSANDWFKATLQDVNGNVEIIYVRTRASGSAVFSNVLRGQEGTTARTFAVGSVAGLRVTASDVQAALGVLGNDNLFTGDNQFSGGNQFANPVNCDITGNAATATNVAYSGLTGTVPTWNQNTTGNAATAGELTTASFSIEQVGADLVIKNGTTVVAKIDSAGNFTTKANVTAYGSL